MSLLHLKVPVTGHFMLSIVTVHFYLLTQTLVLIRAQSSFDSVGYVNGKEQKRGKRTKESRLALSDPPVLQHSVSQF